MNNSIIDSILSLNQELKELEIVNNVNEIEEISEELNTASINLDVDYPYLIFDTIDLIRVINLCNKLILQKSNNISYNSVSLVPILQNKTVLFYVTNELSHFRYRTELLGDVNDMITDNISIPFTIIQKLTKLMGNKILIYKKDNNFYIRLQNGDLLLDAQYADEKVIFFPNEPKDKIAEVSVSYLGNIIDSMLPLLANEISSDNKRINFTGDTAYFNSSSYYIESKIDTPRLSLSLRDAEFISKINKYYKDKHILLFNTNSTVNRWYFKVDKVEYEFINSMNSISDNLISQMNKLIKPVEASVNFIDLFKIVNLATTLPSSTGNIKLKYDKENLIISLTSNKGDSNFKLSFNKLEKSLYSKEIYLRANVLKKLLYSFSKLEQINLAFSDNNIILENDFSKAILITYNI